MVVVLAFVLVELLVEGRAYLGGEREMGESVNVSEGLTQFLDDGLEEQTCPISGGTPCQKIGCDSSFPPIVIANISSLSPRPKQTIPASILVSCP